MIRAALARHAVKNVLIDIRHFKTSAAASLFWEPDEKGGYKDTRPRPSKIKMIRDGMKELKHEIALWKQEIQEVLDTDPIMIYRPGETDIVWKFGSPDALEKWKVSSDSDHNEGFSNCSLTLTKQGKGLFAGYLSLRLPKDGRVKKAGYCNMQTLRARVCCLAAVMRSLLDALFCRNLLNVRPTSTGIVIILWL